ncbi:MAG: Serine/threonine-protein phosphatase 2A activator 2 [Trichoglossum hirsutum]|nr:MAG: Serine/threonine-protein phosphatase 2A activator 2 [Trichoglossum hirsutum]
MVFTNNTTAIVTPVPGLQLPRLAPRRRQPSSSNPTSIPETPPLPPPPSPANLKFTHPTRRILSEHDHKLFLGSPAYVLITSFVFSLADAVRDTPTSAAKVDELSPVVQRVLGILDEAEEAVERCPPEDQGGSRFGNKSFRSFLDAIGKEYERWHRELGVNDAAAIDELSTYFLQAFGNRSRVDYGSGHELNFIAWLLCLYQLHIIQKSDFQTLVLRVFMRYLLLMRRIQSTYYLEPAGSHGVWGLDDYQFLPFLFGASQLLHHPFIRPLSIHQSLILEEYSTEYIYLNQVAFINSVKSVEGLRWHSPMLDDISAAKSWEKVEGGMKKMFLAEVLKKLPVMQHFLFGSLIPAAEGMSAENEFEAVDEGKDAVVVMEDGMKHVHHASSWGDCCGIKVPSSIGASQEMKKKMGREGFRRVPFD